MENKEKTYQIALVKTPGVGYVLSKKLMAQFGSAQAIFHSSLKDLIRVPGISRQLAQTIVTSSAFAEAAELLDYHNKANVQIITLWEKRYPERLKHIYAAPMLLYLRGEVDLNTAKVISIVGTRKATSYGKKVIETLMKELVAYPLMIVSGLAYGIDIYAHKVALELGIPTLAVLAGGLDAVYPSVHKKVAEVMLAQGGLLSEHPLRTKLEAHQFAARNRIIAGIAEATIVVEAGQKSGALITAHCANEYDREVFAVPGSIYEPYSTGCHELIKTHQAHLLTCGTDLVEVLNWDREALASKVASGTLTRLPELTEIEKRVVQTIQNLHKEVHIDELSYQAQVSLNQLAGVLLQLELKNVVKFLPGQKFGLVGS